MYNTRKYSTNYHCVPRQTFILLVIYYYYLSIYYYYCHIFTTAECQLTIVAKFTLLTISKLFQIVILVNKHFLVEHNKNPVNCVYERPSTIDIFHEFPHF